MSALARNIALDLGIKYRQAKALLIEAKHNPLLPIKVGMFTILYDDGVFTIKEGPNRYIFGM